MRFSLRGSTPESVPVQETAIHPELTEDERLIDEHLILTGADLFKGISPAVGTSAEFVEALDHRWNEVAYKPGLVDMDSLKLMANLLHPKVTRLAVPLLGVYVDWEQNYLLRRTHVTTSQEYNEWLEYYLIVNGMNTNHIGFAVSPKHPEMLTADADIHLVPNVKALVADRVHEGFAGLNGRRLYNFTHISSGYSNFIERVRTKVDSELVPETHVFSWNQQDQQHERLPAFPDTKQYLRERGLLHDSTLDWTIGQLAIEEERQT